MQVEAGLLNEEHTQGIVEVLISSEDDIISSTFQLEHLDRAIKALKALKVENIRLAIDKEKGIAVILITDRVGIAMVPVEED